LAGDYQILTALRSAPDSTTYLARHLKLNRDVTITVTKVQAGDDAAVERFAADAKMLSVMRHRSVIPVIEGRRLADGSFAIVRARVRGQTLEQLVANVGAMPVSRVASTLEQVHSAVEWARQNRIANRHVSADAIVFQQGSGRVLLELEPSAKAGAADACDDARTIGRLAYEMLSGYREGNPDAKPLAEARPDLSPRIVKEAESLMQCDSNRGARDAISLIALLSGKSESVAAPAAPRPPRSTVAIPPGPLDSTVVVVKSPFSRTARLATAVAVVAIIGTLGIVLLTRDRDDNTRRATAGDVARTKTDAGGEVIPTATPRRDGFHSVPTASAAVTSPPQVSPPAVVAPTKPAPVAAKPTQTATPTQSRPKPPVTRRSEPPRGMARSKLPDPVAPPRDTTTLPAVNRPDSVAPPVVTTTPSADGCDSPDDQQRCLMAAIERNDRELNSAYQRLIAALRRQAGVGSMDADPASVDALSEAQRHWITTRDSACRNVGSGPLWAKVRADCFAGQSARRTEELNRRLRSMPQGH
jgi:uncharacterized protein YecT (DUF1311 family)/serine/threonine protein kinase